MKETIATAALLVNGEVWTLPRPARHNHLIMAWAHVHTPAMLAKPIVRIPEHVQGFVTSEGRFVNRQRAARLALEAHQIPAPKVQLYSEDLW